MIEKNLPSIKIHKLTQEQYNKLQQNGELESEAFYLVDDEVELDTEITENSTHKTIPTSKAVYDLVQKLVQEALNNT